MQIIFLPNSSDGLGFSLWVFWVLCCFLSALKSGTKPWNPGTLEPWKLQLDCEAGSIFILLKSYPVGILTQFIAGWPGWCQAGFDLSVWTCHRSSRRSPEKAATLRDRGYRVTWIKWRWASILYPTGLRKWNCQWPGWTSEKTEELDQARVASIRGTVQPRDVTSHYVPKKNDGGLISTYGVFHKWGIPKMDGLWGKILLKWMIWGYPYFRKPPCEKSSWKYTYIFY